MFKVTDDNIHWEEEKEETHNSTSLILSTSCRIWLNTMNSLLPRIYMKLDSTVCSRYMVLCATFSAIFTTEAMPTESVTTLEAKYATAEFTTEISLDEHDVCNRLSRPLQISTLLCRAKVDKCDLPEYCSSQGSCPSNTHLADKTPCDFNAGICYRGQCLLTNSPCGAFLAHTFPSEPVTSHSNSSYDIPSETVVCNRREVCVDGRCLRISDIKDNTCPSSTNGKRCSGNGFCTNENRCICTCGWFGSGCQFNGSNTNDVIPRISTNRSRWCLPKEQNNGITGVFPTPVEENTRNPHGGGNSDSDDIASATFVANAIIGGSIALMFAVAVIFGATSIGFRKVRKKDRLRTMHQFKILSIFQPTKAQQRKLMKQNRPRYSKGYRERRNDISKNKDQRIILEPASKHSNHVQKSKQPHVPRQSRPKKGSSKLVSETMV